MAALHRDRLPRGAQARLDGKERLDCPFSGWQLPHLGFGRDWDDGGDWIALSGLAASRRDQVPQGARARLGRRLRFDAFPRLAAPRHDQLPRGAQVRLGRREGLGCLGWRPYVATKYHWGRGRVRIDGSDWIALSRLVASRRDQTSLGARARFSQRERLGRSFLVGGFPSQPAATGGVGSTGLVDAIGSSCLGWQSHVATDFHGGLRREWATSVGCMKWATAR